MPTLSILITVEVSSSIRDGPWPAQLPEAAPLELTPMLRLLVVTVLVIRSRKATPAGTVVGPVWLIVKVRHTQEPPSFTVWLAGVVPIMALVSARRSEALTVRLLLFPSRRRQRRSRKSPLITRLLAKAGARSKSIELLRVMV